MLAGLTSVRAARGDWVEVGELIAELKALCRKGANSAGVTSAAKAAAAGGAVDTDHHQSEREKQERLRPKVAHGQGRDETTSQASQLPSVVPAPVSAPAARQVATPSGPESTSERSKQGAPAHPAPTILAVATSKLPAPPPPPTSAASKLPEPPQPPPPSGIRAAPVQQRPKQPLQHQTREYWGRDQRDASQSYAWVPPRGDDARRNAHFGDRGERERERAQRPTDGGWQGGDALRGRAREHASIEDYADRRPLAHSHVRPPTYGPAPAGDHARHEAAEYGRPHERPPLYARNFGRQHAHHQSEARRPAHGDPAYRPETYNHEAARYRHHAQARIGRPGSSRGRYEDRYDSGAPHHVAPARGPHELEELSGGHPRWAHERAPPRAHDGQEHACAGGRGREHAAPAHGSQSDRGRPEVGDRYGQELGSYHIGSRHAVGKRERDWDHVRIDEQTRARAPPAKRPAGEPSSAQPPGVVDNRQHIPGPAPAPAPLGERVKHVETNVSKQGMYGALPAIPNIQRTEKSFTLEHWRVGDKPEHSSMSVVGICALLAEGAAPFHGSTPVAPLATCDARFAAKVFADGSNVAALLQHAEKLAKLLDEADASILPTPGATDKTRGDQRQVMHKRGSEACSEGPKTDATDVPTQARGVSQERGEAQQSDDETVLEIVDATSAEEDIHTDASDTPVTADTVESAAAACLDALSDTALKELTYKQIQPLVLAHLGGKCDRAKLRPFKSVVKNAMMRAYNDRVAALDGVDHEEEAQAETEAETEVDMEELRNSGSEVKLSEATKKQRSSREVSVADPSHTIVPTPVPVAPSGNWSCMMCTLENDAGSRKCFACGARRPRFVAPTGVAAPGVQTGPRARTPQQPGQGAHKVKDKPSKSVSKISKGTSARAGSRKGAAKTGKGAAPSKATAESKGVTAAKTSMVPLSEVVWDLAPPALPVEDDAEVSRAAKRGKGPAPAKSTSKLRGKASAKTSSAPLCDVVWDLAPPALPVEDEGAGNDGHARGGSGRSNDGGGAGGDADGDQGVSDSSDEELSEFKRAMQRDIPRGWWRNFESAEAMSSYVRGLLGEDRWHVSAKTGPKGNPTFVCKHTIGCHVFTSLTEALYVNHVHVKRVSRAWEGRHVLVYWSNDDKWYAGWLTNLEGTVATFEYADGDVEENMNLLEQTFVWQSDSLGNPDELAEVTPELQAILRDERVRDRKLRREERRRRRAGADVAQVAEESGAAAVVAEDDAAPSSPPGCARLMPLRWRNVATTRRVPDGAPPSYPPQSNTAADSQRQARRRELKGLSDPRFKAKVTHAAVASSREARASMRATQGLLAANGEWGEGLASELAINLGRREKYLLLRRSPIHDFGVVAGEFIAANEFVVEYVGETVGKVVSNLRERAYELSGLGSFYLFGVDTDYVIDATRVGTIARYINHSCEPNCVSRIVRSDGTCKVALYAKSDINPGEELCYDYKLNYEEGEDRIPCMCGAKTCRGWLN